MSSDSFGFLGVLGALASLAITIFWLVLGSRFVRAHEDIAESLRRLGRRD